MSEVADAIAGRDGPREAAAFWERMRKSVTVMYGRRDIRVYYAALGAAQRLAQCVAAHGGLLARAAGRCPSPGMLVGARRIELLRREFAPGEMLEVEARYAGSAGALASFACALRAGPEIVATGLLSVYVSDALGISAEAGT